MCTPTRTAATLTNINDVAPVGAIARFPIGFKIMVWGKARGKRPYCKPPTTDNAVQNVLLSSRQTCFGHHMAKVPSLHPKGIAQADGPAIDNISLM